MFSGRQTTILCLVFAASVVLSTAALGGPKGPMLKMVTYKGRMVDEAGKPVSGIFPLTFKLFKGVKSKKAIWTESMWVAVDRGIYTVQLGEEKNLPDREDLTKLVLGVEIKGIGEVTREPFLSQGPIGPVSRPAPADSPKSGGSAKFADTAGYAVEAEHAKNADRIQNLSIDDITRKVIEEGGGGGKVRIGKTRRYGARVGGSGGTSEYNETCPRGYVMTGIRGGAGIYLDSIQIVCSPIE